jgi:hypothetical protein
MKIKLYLLLTITVGFTFVVSCKRNSQDPLWNVDLLAPLIQASLSMNNIVKDTSFIKKNPDHSLTIVSRQELAKITLDSLVTLNTPPFNKTVKLSSLVLDTRKDTTRITVGQIAQALIDNGQATLGNGIKLAAALHIPIDLSSIPPMHFYDLPIDVTQFFKEADIATGTLTVEIVNNLPIDVQSLSFNIKNSVDQASIINHTFTNISANGGSDNTSQNLAGKHVEGDLIADINNLQLNGGSSVYVNLNQSLDVILTISGVSVTDAIAVFPNQDVVQNQDEVPLIGLTNGVQLTESKIASGSVKVEVFSTAQDKIYFDYSIPSATKNGQVFQVQTTVPAALPGQTSHSVFTYDISGYTMDLTGSMHDTINTFYNTLNGKIKYTGKKVHLSLSDSITVSISTVNLKPSYVKGYLGQQTVNLGPASTNLDIFKSIQSGTLNFENVNLKLVIDNGFGIDGAVTINTITASNTKTGASQTLTGTNIGVPLTINKATDNPYVNTINNVDISASSNATSLINLLPNKIDYAVQVNTNLSGNLGTFNDFAYKTGSLAAYLDVEMPLSLIASQLVLCDTVAFNTSSIKKKNVNSGTFSVFVDNGFPLNASLKMYFLNLNGKVIDSVKSLPGAILTAPVNAANKVKEKRSSVINFEVDEMKMNNLYNTRMVIFKIEFTTEPNATYMKIYNDYSIDFRMVGDMDYSVHKK